jgi:hypothetical protein
MTTKTKLEALLAQTVTGVEKFITLKAGGMDFRAQLQETFANCLNIADAVLLFAFDAVARNVLLELEGQVLFDFARTHE